MRRSKKTQRIIAKVSIRRRAAELTQLEAVRLCVCECCFTYHLLLKLS